MGQSLRFDLARTSIGFLGNLKTWITIGDANPVRILTPIQKCHELFFRLIDSQPFHGNSKIEFFIDHKSDNRTIWIRLQLGNQVLAHVPLLVENVLAVYWFSLNWKIAVFELVG